jgi:glucosyl-dolichyl phosphate glucuronosyltransferase
MDEYLKYNLSVVVPTFNRQELLKSLLESLEKVKVPKDATFDVSIVDNNSTDQTKAVVKEFIEKNTLKLRYIFEKKQGASHARNRGVREASGPIIGFLDDDEVVDDYWLTAIIGGFKRFRCDGISGRTFARWLFPPPKWYTTEGPFRIIGPTAGHNLGEKYLEYKIKTRMPTTANLAIRKDCFNKFGYFRTDMGPVQNDEYFIGEDTEFCYRLVNGGARLFYVPEAVVYNIVHEDRLTKDFCKRYYFRIGRGMAMFIKPTKKDRTIIGIPIYLFREYFESLIAWALTVYRKDRKAALYYRLQINRITGKIYQLFMNRVDGKVKNMI